MQIGKDVIINTTAIQEISNKIHVESGWTLSEVLDILADTVILSLGFVESSWYITDFSSSDVFRVGAESRIFAMKEKWYFPPNKEKF